ncbi:MAG TPA: LUD domain-containing protein [Candidatus Limnocylindrales bacterium]|nr:LUD domain-containing protein [Candidatus Limnocylindrales bacterium]
MNERELILGRIREALKVPAPLPGHHGDERSSLTSATVPTQVRQWLPAIGESFADRVKAFRRKCSELKADFHALDSEGDCVKLLTDVRDREQWKRLGAHRGDLTDFVCSRLGLPICNTDKGYDVAGLESCDAGLTECDALVAQTGSVLLTSRSAGGRALSVLPPHHVVLARREQLVRDLPEAFAVLKKKYGSNYPSFISFITGPSRTGDIERILVLGAHGPKKLTICCF